MTERDEERIRRDAEKKRRAQLLRRALDDSGLTQLAFADKIGMGREQFNRYVNGREPFGRSLEIRFEEGFGLPAGHFAKPQAQSQAVGATLDDVLDELQLLRDEVVDLRVAVRQLEAELPQLEDQQSASGRG